jgi:hypothetical protein
MKSVEELREARLRAFGGQISSPRISFSLLGQKIDTQKLLQVAAGSNVSSEDLSRWFLEGFSFSDPNFGLKQGQGGPCGILAAVQAELLRNLLFSTQTPISDSFPIINEVDLRVGFAHALWNILLRCKTSDNVFFVRRFLIILTISLRYSRSTKLTLRLS